MKMVDLQLEEIKRFNLSESNNYGADLIAMVNRTLNIVEHLRKEHGRDAVDTTNAEFVFTQKRYEPDHAMFFGVRYEPVKADSDRIEIWNPE